MALALASSERFGREGANERESANAARPRDEVEEVAAVQVEQRQTSTTGIEDDSEEKTLSYQRKLPEDVAHLRERPSRGADDDLRALRGG